MRTILLWALLAGVVQCQLLDDPVFINDYGLELPVEQDTSGATDQDDVQVPMRNWDSVNNVSTFATSPRIGLFIIGGQDSAYGDHPYICRLDRRYGGYWYFACGAVIFNKHTVMTAAHCLTGRVAGEIRVVCGDYRRFTPDAYEVTKQIVHITVHPRFMIQPGSPGDIAVMRVESPLVFNDFVNTIPIPKRTTPLPEECQLIGWGLTDSSLFSLPDIVQETTIDVISNSRCQSFWGRRLIGFGHVCFLDPRNVTTGCSGDSGGPAVCGGYLVGLASFSAGGCPPFYPSNITPTSHGLTFYRRLLKHNA